VVARSYVDFLEAVVEGRKYTPAADRATFETEAAAVGREGLEQTSITPPSLDVEPEYIRSWAPDPEAAVYIETHITRLEKTLAITPLARPGDRILEMGAYLHITPALSRKLGYSEVRGCYYGPAGRVDHRTVFSSDGEEFSCDLELFDAEKDRFPYCDNYFATVLCCELIEHLTCDPMHMMSEINRILRPGGHVVLTTPNIGSLRAIAAILEGYHPGFFPAYIRPRGEGEEPEARHNREYTPREILRLFLDAGFETTLLETGPFHDEPKPEQEWVKNLLARYQMPVDLRGDGIYAVGRKTGPLRTRYPAWLYQ
jgi:SAM-dependent methyltransferase